MRRRGVHGLILRRLRHVREPFVLLNVPFPPGGAWPSRATGSNPLDWEGGAMEDAGPLEDLYFNGIDGAGQPLHA